MEREELNNILEEHKLFIETRFSREKKGCRADLRNVDLSGVDLSSVDLRKAILTGANLSGADLSGAILNGAIFIDANLDGANLDGVDLTVTTLGLGDSLKVKNEFHHVSKRPTLKR
ncbi:MAG: pentapeptide repeat-containing protein [Lachnospiraceae bacterium]